MTVTCEFFFFFNDTATTEIYTLSLHDALPISPVRYNMGVASKPVEQLDSVVIRFAGDSGDGMQLTGGIDRKSTRLNSSHVRISYAVFCLKKKNQSASRRRPAHASASAPSQPQR